MTKYDSTTGLPADASPFEGLTFKTSVQGTASLASVFWTGFAISFLFGFVFKGFDRWEPAEDELGFFLVTYVVLFASYAAFAAWFFWSYFRCFGNTKSKVWKWIGCLYPFSAVMVSVLGLATSLAALRP